MDKQKRQALRRTLTQCAAFALSNGYLRGFAEGKIYKGKGKALCVPGLSCYSCPGALGSCPIGALQAVLDGGKFRFAAYVMGVLLLFGTLLGRLVCGWLCPFGLVQELFHKIPFPKKRKNLPGHRLLTIIKYIVLLLFVILLPMTATNSFGMGKPWFCQYICPSGTLLGGLPLLLANKSLRGNLGWLFGLKVGLLVLFLVLSVLTYRPFCKYVCPLGAIYGCFNPISLSRMEIAQDKCIHCGKCQAVCGMDIRVWEQPNHVACIRCGKCKAVCPQDAITSTMDQLLKNRHKKSPGAVSED